MKIVITANIREHRTITAEALIAAGIGDVKDLTDYYTNELHGAERRIKKAEYRAEAAEARLKELRGEE